MSKTSSKINDEELKAIPNTSSSRTFEERGGLADVTANTLSSP
jgi:hypothetical protein